MSTVMEPRVRPEASVSSRLREETAAVRVNVRWLGTRRTLSPTQKQVAAETFDADDRCLSASKRLIDTSHPMFRRVTRIRSQALGFFRSSTLPFPEQAVRLLKRDDLEQFENRMNSFRDQLRGAVAELDEHFAELRQNAAEQLGQLYDERDYPDSLAGFFDFQWDYPAMEVPRYLLQLSPSLYEAESRRLSSRFESAIEMAEEAFASEFSKLVNHLAERLQGEDGQPRVFRDSVVSNLSEFFDRFRHLNLRSSEDLDQLIEQAQSVVSGVEPQGLRDDANLRIRVASDLQIVSAELDDLMENRPRRNLLRRGS